MGGTRFWRNASAKVVATCCKVSSPKSPSVERLVRLDASASFSRVGRQLSNPESEVLGGAGPYIVGQRAQTADLFLEGLLLLRKEQARQEKNRHLNFHSGFRS